MRFSPIALRRTGLDARALCLAALLSTTTAVAQQPAADAAAAVAAPVAAAPAAGENPATAETPYGWPWLVRALDRLKPSVDTSLPETSSQAAERLEAAIGAGRAREALAEIAERERARAAQGLSGEDARLLFLKGRALAAQGDLAGAHAVYQDMTTRFPELPEPWNNLAAVQVAQGQLDAALQSLQMALLTDPGYAAAKANLGDVHLMLASRAYRSAAEQGVPGAGSRAQQLRQLIETQTP